MKQGEYFYITTNETEPEKNCLQSRLNEDNLSLILELATEILDVVNMP